MKVNSIQPKGFKELIEFFQTKNGSYVEANEIQEFLQKEHGLTAGQVTGTIKRACDGKVINKIGRGTYELNLNGNVSENKNPISSVISDAIDNAISKIEVMAGQRIAVIKQDDLQKIQDVIVKLKQIKQENID